MALVADVSGAAMSATGKTTEPSERAMKAAVVMEVHAACSTTTRAKALALDELFPGHDALLKALADLCAAYAACNGEDHPAYIAARAALLQAKG